MSARIASCSLVLLGGLLGCATTPEPDDGQSPDTNEPRERERNTAADLPSAYELCDRAEESLKAGNLAEALRDVDGAASLDPKLARIYHLKGIVHRRLDQPKKALKAFERCLILDVDYAEPDYLLEGGRAYLEAGRLKGAKILVRRAKDPGPDLLVLSARVKALTGDMNGALGDVVAALEAAPEHEGASALKARLEDEIKQREVHYQPKAAPERLGGDTLSLEGQAHLSLPKGFKPRGRSTRPRARKRYGDAEATLSLKAVSDPGGDLDSWRSALVAEAEVEGGTVASARASKRGDVERVLLHIIEPSPESGMLEPFTIVRYQWFARGFARGSEGAVRVTLEMEVAQGRSDIPDAVRFDLLAALATFELEGVN